MDIEQIKVIAKEQIEKLEACLKSGQMLLTDEDWEIIDALVDMAAYFKGLRGAMEQVARFQDVAFKHGAMMSAPCFVCEYNGPDYFNPAVHPCAERHHRLMKK